MPGLHYRFRPTPIGSPGLAGANEGPDVHRLSNRQGAVTPGLDWLRDDAAFPEARTQRGAYFDGRLTHFDLALAPRGPPFRHAVWQAPTEIPPGETISYGELVHRIRHPSAKPGRRSSQQCQPAAHRGAMPRGHRRRRTRDETLPAGAGTRPTRPANPAGPSATR